jgi:hypothetical protein
MLNKILCAVMLACLVGCDTSPPQCNTVTAGEARVVAYRVAKSSRIWIEDVKTKHVFEFSSLGGRRAPTVALGTVVPIQYCETVGYTSVVKHVLFDKYKYVDYPSGDSSTRFESLPGYSHLYPY